MLVRGPSAGAKARANVILKALGWTRAIDVGGIDGSRRREAPGPRWVRVCNAIGTLKQEFDAARV